MDTRTERYQEHARPISPKNPFSELSVEKYLVPVVFPEKDKVVISISEDVQCFIPSVLAKKGVICVPLAKAEEYVKSYLKEQSREAVTEAVTNTILSTTGFFLLVPPNVEVEAKIISYANALTADKNIIVVEKNSSLKLLHEVQAAGQKTARCSAITVIGKEHATITIFHLLYARNEKTNIVENIVLDAHASLHRVVAHVEGENLKVHSTITLAGEYAQVDDKELFLCSKTQQYVFDTIIHHKASYTVSNAVIKGVAKDAASCKARGIVRIDKDTKQTSSNLSEHVLLLNKGAKADAIPSMEIEALDVQARHSASVSHLDENQLFYAMARGIPLDEARKMIVFGFLSAVSESIPNIQDMLTRKMGE